MEITFVFSPLFTFPRSFPSKSHRLLKFTFSAFFVLHAPFPTRTHARTHAQKADAAEKVHTHTKNRLSPGSSTHTPHARTHAYPRTGIAVQFTHAHTHAHMHTNDRPSHVETRCRLLSHVRAVPNSGVLYFLGAEGRVVVGGGRLL